MSYHRKKNPKKSSSSSSSSTSSFENHLWQNTEEPIYRTFQSSSSESSMKRPTYPNVPKRTQRSSFTNEHETIQTESRIDIIPSDIHSQKPNEYSSTISSSNHSAYTRHTLDLITKYTSPQKIFQESNHRPFSPVQSQIGMSSMSQPIYGSKGKRTLSPLDETNQNIHEPKRTKSFDEDEDDDDNELSQFIDHRRSKRNLSQNSNTTISSQLTTDDGQRKPTTRKPTVRKLSINQQKPILSQPIPKKQLTTTTSTKPRETLIIESDFDIEEDNTIDRESTSWLSKHTQISNTQPNSHTESEDHLNHSLSAPIIPSPMKLLIDNCHDILNLNIPCTPIKPRTPVRSLRQILENRVNNRSPCANIGGGERRFSSTSSTSLAFDTPNSSFSRMTTTNMVSTPRTVTKTDRETEMFLPSNIDMINQLILQTNLNINHNETTIDYNPNELSKNLFYQGNSFLSNNEYQTSNLIKKWFLKFGRYEIETPFPINYDKKSTIYACDTCLKHLHDSSIAFQRHKAKCLYTQPPGKIVYNKKDLAIFEIGETNMTMEQRIYVKSLCRISRLFIDSNKSIDDTKIDRFAYYILCRRDPILSQSQSSIYRFIGYFSKQLNQYGQESVNNLSCLFVLPPFAQHQEYDHLLIAFSYFLVRSTPSTNLMYSTPARPLDNIALSALRIYWRDILFAYIINHNHSSIKSIALDTFARQTSIHPRDILSSLCSDGFIVPHPIHTSSVYLLNNAYHSMTSLNSHIKNEFLFIDMKLIDTDDGQKIITKKQSTDKSHDSNIEEIVLD